MSTTATHGRRPRRPIQLWHFVAGAITLFALCFFGLPLLWLFTAASQTEASLFTAPPFSWGSWVNVVEAWGTLVDYEGTHLGLWIWNSVIYSVGGVGLSLVAALPAGYMLATQDFPGRRAILLVTMIAMITPNAAVVLPIFLEMNLIGLNNTRISMVMATAFFPFGVYLAFIYYATSMPKEVLNSARVDGASAWQVFTRIVLPLSKPVAALIAFFSFVSNWSNYFLAFVLLSDDSLYNLPVGITSLISSSRALSFAGASGAPIRRPGAILAALMIVIPVLLIFLFSQRFIRSGQLAGSEKG